MFKLLTDSLFVAICRSNWLCSRKYGTVWYYPASSSFYLTFFHPLSVSGKIAGTLPDFDAWATCVKPANSACCVLGVRCWFYVNTLYVNTKNWYREETDMWAEFGRRTPFDRRFSSKHSVEASAVGSTSSFGRRTVPRMKAEAFGSAWWRGLDTKKEMSWWWIRDGHDAMVLIIVVVVD
jgi:hypothetical protein